MSARAFTGFARQFTRAARFERAYVPKVAPKMWRNNGKMFESFAEMNHNPAMNSKMMRNVINRMRCAEMQKIQIGALYMFSYVSKEFLEILKHYEELLDDAEAEEEEERTTLTGRLL